MSSINFPAVRWVASLASADRIRVPLTRLWVYVPEGRADHPERWTWTATDSYTIGRHGPAPSTDAYTDHERWYSVDAAAVLELTTLAGARKANASAVFTDDGVTLDVDRVKVRFERIASLTAIQAQQFAAGEALAEYGKSRTRVEGVTAADMATLLDARKAHAKRVRTRAAEIASPVRVDEFRGRYVLSASDEIDVAWRLIDAPRDKALALHPARLDQACAFGCPVTRNKDTEPRTVTITGREYADRNGNSGFHSHPLMIEHPLGVSLLMPMRVN